ncbi:MAG: hypothetical protein IT381_23340 [Deltaproteobacteria bacterium]|nr:hypothetical protein [Deltaproteobacteria bacterium]
MKKWFMALGAALVIAVIAFVVHEHHGGHDHAAGGDSAKLTLHDGAKWETDAPMKEEMAAIKDEVAAALGGIRGGAYSPEQYGALADAIVRRVNAIFSKCKLPPEVDAQAHLVLGELLAGAAAMKGEGDRSAGAAKVVRALAAYGDHFAHPGWQPLER